jgi:hypothetical protein
VPARLALLGGEPDVELRSQEELDALGWAAGDGLVTLKEVQREVAEVRRGGRPRGGAPALVSSGGHKGQLTPRNQWHHHPHHTVYVGTLLCTTDARYPTLQAVVEAAEAGDGVTVAQFGGHEDTHLNMCLSYGNGAWVNLANLPGIHLEGSADGTWLPQTASLQASLRGEGGARV